MSEPVVYEIVNPDTCHCERCQFFSVDYTQNGLPVPEDMHGVSHHGLVEVMEDHPLLTSGCFICNVSVETAFSEGYYASVKQNYKAYNVGPREGKKPAWL